MYPFFKCKLFLIKLLPTNKNNLCNCVKRNNVCTYLMYICNSRLRKRVDKIQMILVLSFGNIFSIFLLKKISVQ